VAAFVVLAQQHPCRCPEGPEQVLFGANGITHDHDHANGVVDNFFEHVLRHAARVPTLPDDA
jgi:hypothetical protein